MPADDSPIDYVDYTSINFPSDRISVKDIRRAHPERFDVEDAKRFERTQEDMHFTLGLVIYLERLLARAAYEEAIGKVEDVMGGHGLTRNDCLDELTKFYGTYRVAHGRHHTEQLIRDIESQAGQQAVGRKK